MDHASFEPTIEEDVHDRPVHNGALRHRLAGTDQDRLGSPVEELVRLANERRGQVEPVLPRRRLVLGRRG